MWYDSLLSTQAIVSLCEYIIVELLMYELCNEWGRMVVGAVFASYARTLALTCWAI